MSRVIPSPRTRFVRWLADVGQDLPDEVQTRLRSSLASSFLPMIAAALNATVLCLVGWLRTGNTTFLWLGVVEAVVLGGRFIVFRVADRHPDLWFLGGLLWPLLHGGLVGMAVASGDFGLVVLVLVSALGAICVLVARHFAAPRYPLVQSALIEVGFLVSLAVHHPELLIVVLLQLAAFCVGKVSVVRQLRDMTIRAITNEIASHRQSISDPLTGLLNRRGLEAEFARRRTKGQPVALFYLDLDGFKAVNDNLGHGTGDALLGQVAHRLRETCRRDAVIARIGGDEFLVLSSASEAEETLALGRRMVARLGEPYSLEDVVLARIGVSVGIARSDAGAGSLESLIARADRALYAAKAAGKGRCLDFGELEFERSRAGRAN
jgi:diguanylate cyclase (GGDEF)-like protein